MQAASLPTKYEKFGCALSVASSLPQRFVKYPSMEIQKQIKEDKTEVENTVGHVETGSISKICFNNVKQSKVFEFKPNDLTVNSTWNFLSQKLDYL